MAPLSRGEFTTILRALTPCLTSRNLGETTSADVLLNMVFSYLCPAPCDQLAQLQAGLDASLMQGRCMIAREAVQKGELVFSCQAAHITIYQHAQVWNPYTR